MFSSGRERMLIQGQVPGPMVSRRVKPLERTRGNAKPVVLADEYGHRAPRPGHHVAGRILAGLEAGDPLERRRSDPEHLAGNGAVALEQHRVRATRMEVEGAGDCIAPNELLPRQQVMPDAAPLQRAVYEEQPRRLGCHASSLRGADARLVRGDWPDLTPLSQWAWPALADIHHQGFVPEGCPTMESMGKKPRRRRSSTPEFKAQIVELCQREDRSVGQVARDFDLAETAVREWVKQGGSGRGNPAGRRPGQRGAAGAGRAAPGESQAPRGCEILKRPTAFFAKETR